MSSKAVQNRLPTLALLLDGVGLFCVKGLSNENASIVGDKFDNCSATAELHLDQTMGNNLGVSSSEVEAEAAVFGLHAGGKGTTHS